MKSAHVLLFGSLFFLSACGTHKGTTKPNWFLADLDKYGEAYYLSVEQVRVGDTKETVINEYGPKYDVSSDRNTETWTFKSYRATGFRDPLDKMVYVYFENNHVIEVREELIGRGASPVRAQAPDTVDALRQLKGLYDEGIISEQEYDDKKQEILNRM